MWLCLLVNQGHAGIRLSLSRSHPSLSQLLTRPSKWVCTRRNYLMKRIKVMQQIKIACAYVCTPCCRSKAPVWDLIAEYISHLDKNSRFTVTKPQQHKPRAHINLQKPRHSFVKEQIVWICGSFFCVLCQLCTVKGGLLRWECICLAALAMEKTTIGNKYQIVHKHSV